MTTEGKQTVYVVWGDRTRILDVVSDYDMTKEEFTDEEIDEVIEEFTFATPAEMKAFLIGVECGSGYSAYWEADTLEDAREHVRSIVCEYVNMGSDEDEEKEDDP
jgi:hypothetical protein